MIDKPRVEVLLSSQAFGVLPSRLSFALDAGVSPALHARSISAELLSFLRRATEQRSGVIGFSKGIGGGGTGNGDAEGWEHATEAR